MQPPLDPSNVTSINEDNIQRVEQYLVDAWSGLVATILDGDMSKLTGELEFNHHIARLDPSSSADASHLNRIINRIKRQGGYHDRIVFWSSLSHLALLQGLMLFYRTAKEKSQCPPSPDDTMKSSPKSSTKTDPLPTTSPGGTNGTESSPPSPPTSTRTTPTSKTSDSDAPASKESPASSSN